MKKVSMVALMLGILVFTSCKKEKLVTPNASEQTAEEVTSELENSQLKSTTVDPRNKFVGTYTGVSISSTSAYGPSISGQNFKFAVSKITTTTNKMKIIVTMNGSVAGTFTTTASSNNLNFTGSVSAINFVKNITMLKTSTTALPTNFIYSETGGFTGGTSKYVVLNPTKK